MSRGVKIALAIVGVAVVVLVIVVFVMVDHVDDGTHAASKRVTPDNVERFDTLVVLPNDATAFAVSDVEDRMNRLDAIDEYTEVSHDTLAYLLSIDDDPAAAKLVASTCANPTTRGYAVALVEPSSDSRQQFASALGDAATVRAARYEPPKTEIFMQVKATPEQTRAMRSALDDDRDVVRYRFISHANAYEEFRRLFADQPQLIESERSDGSGLPESFRLELRDGAAPKAVAARYRDLPGVDTVNVPATARGVPTASPFAVCKAR